VKKTNAQAPVFAYHALHQIGLGRASLMTCQHHIAVAPVEGGWSVVCDGGLEPVMFLSGARAEAQARALASRLSEAVGDVVVTVRDRSRTVVGSLRYCGGRIA